MRRLIFVMWGAVMLAGCMSAYRREVLSAEEAFAARDLQKAMEHYQKACEIRKGQDPICERAAEVTALRKEELHQQATLACEQGDVPGCVKVLREAGELLPLSVREEFLEKAASRHALRCETEATPDLGGRVQTAECLAKVASLLDLAWYQDATRAAKESVAEELVQLASTPLAQSLPGAQFLTLRKAVSLDKSYEHLVAPAQKAFLSTVLVPVQIDTRWDGGGLLENDVICQEVVRLAGNGRIFCADPMSPPADTFRIRGVLRKSPVAHYTTTLRQTKRYQDGVQYLPNPAYDAAVVRVQQAEAALWEVEMPLTSARASCEAAKEAYFAAPMEEKDEARVKEDRACEKFEGLKEVYERRERELKDAKYALSRTDSQIVVPIERDYEWTEIHHQWCVDVSYDLKVEGAKKPVLIQDQVKTVCSDGVARDGFAPAGVEASVPNVPGEGDFRAWARNVLRSRLEEIVKEELKVRAEEKSRVCPAGKNNWDLEWLDCRARATFLATGSASF